MRKNYVCIYCSSLNIICCLWPTVVSLITDADHSTCTVAMAAAEPRAGLANVNMVHSPALPLSGPLLLNPAELGRPETNHTNIQQITKGLNCFNWQQRELLPVIRLVCIKI